MVGGSAVMPFNDAFYPLAPYDFADTTRYRLARYEHAWLLRAEGLTYREIGERLGGLTKSRARQLVATFGGRVKRAARYVHIQVVIN